MPQLWMDVVVGLLYDLYCLTVTKKAATVHSLRALSGEIRGKIPDDWLGTVIRVFRTLIGLLLPLIHSNSECRIRILPLQGNTFARTLGQVSQPGVLSLTKYVPRILGVGMIAALHRIVAPKMTPPLSRGRYCLPVQVLICLPGYAAHYYAVESHG
ncbi:hypothetical protein SDJN02_17731, partial [Cucurbita argyrosperma subsp. argyrosperma]